MQIIENLIPKSLHNQIRNTLMGQEFPWYYREWTSSPDGVNSIPHDGNTVESPQFVHSFFLDDKVYSEHYGLVAPFFLFLEDKFNIQISKVHRIKANLLLQNEHFPENSYNTPHVDNMNRDSLRNRKDMILVYYVNESDGDTVVFNETVEVDNNRNYLIPSQYTINTRIHPKESNALLFGANTIHASCHPKQAKRRIVLNFLFELK